jgi:hypothetical protein
MIGQYLPNNNENTTVPILQKILHLNRTLYDGAFVPVTTRHNRCGGIPGLETTHSVADTDSCTGSSDDITFFTFWLLQLCALGFLFVMFGW